MPALDDFSNEDFANMAAAIRAGTAPDDLVDELADLLADTSTQRLEAVAAEEGAAVGFDAAGNPIRGQGKTALEDLVDAVQDATGRSVDGIEVAEERGEAFLSDAEQEAVDTVESLLMPTAGRDADFFFRLREALQTGNAEFSEQVTQDLLDRIPESERERLADEAVAVAERSAVAGMTRADFPEVERATEPASGRTVANYWRPLRDQLETGDPGAQDILRSQNVPDDQIEALMANEDVRNEFIEKVEGQIERIRGTAEPGEPAADVVDTTGVSVDPERAISARARQLVPGTEREDWLTQETWRASQDRIRLEQRFVEWVLKTFGQPKRWDVADFKLQPDNRDISMRQWARLQIEAGNASASSATNAGLPAEWFEDL